MLHGDVTEWTKQCTFLNLRLSSRPLAFGVTPTNQLEMVFLVGGGEHRVAYRIYRIRRVELPLYATPVHIVAQLEHVAGPISPSRTRIHAVFGVKSFPIVGTLSCLCIIDGDQP